MDRMKFNDNDQALIEKALKFAAANTTDYTEIRRYVEVWKKLENNSNIGNIQYDGFRYDYDE
jgi:hypothetical protein